MSVTVILKVVGTVATAAAAIIGTVNESRKGSKK